MARMKSKPGDMTYDPTLGQCSMGPTGNNAFAAEMALGKTQSVSKKGSALLALIDKQTSEMADRPDDDGGGLTGWFKRTFGGHDMPNPVAPEHYDAVRRLVEQGKDDEAIQLFTTLTGISRRWNADQADAWAKTADAAGVAYDVAIVTRDVSATALKLIATGTGNAALHTGVDIALVASDVTNAWAAKQFDRGSFPTRVAVEGVIGLVIGPVLKAKHIDGITGTLYAEGVKAATRIIADHEGGRYTKKDGTFDGTTFVVDILLAITEATMAVALGTVPSGDAFTDVTVEAFSEGHGQLMDAVGDQLD
jgi:hypothetical protein